MKREATAQVNPFISSDAQNSIVPTEKFKEAPFVVWIEKPEFQMSIVSFGKLYYLISTTLFPGIRRLKTKYVAS